MITPTLQGSGRTLAEPMPVRDRPFGDGAAGPPLPVGIPACRALALLRWLIHGLPPPRDAVLPIRRGPAPYSGSRPSPQLFTSTPRLRAGAFSHARQAGSSGRLSPYSWRKRHTRASAQQARRDLPAACGFESRRGQTKAARPGLKPGRAASLRSALVRCRLLPLHRGRVPPVPARVRAQDARVVLRLTRPRHPRARDRAAARARGGRAGLRCGRHAVSLPDPGTLASSCPATRGRNDSSPSHFDWLGLLSPTARPGR